MKILIVGAGVVGYNLAEELSQEGHDISIIDNDADILKGMQTLLSGWDCHVICATDGRDAVSRMPESRPDIALVDYHLDEGDGISAIRMLSRPRTSKCGAPVTSTWGEVGPEGGCPVGSTAWVNWIVGEVLSTMNCDCVEITRPEKSSTSSVK